MPWNVLLHPDFDDEVGVLVLRIYRAIVLGATMSAGWVAFVMGLTGGVLILCGMLTWHLGNFPIRRWPPLINGSI